MLHTFSPVVTPDSGGGGSGSRGRTAGIIANATSKLHLAAVCDVMTQTAADVVVTTVTRS